MSKKIKLSAFFLAIYFIFSSISVAANLILPEEKPKIDEYTKAKINKKKEILPQKKPDIKIKESDVAKEKKKDEGLNKEVFIYPEKKPLVLKQ